MGTVFGYQMFSSNVGLLLLLCPFPKIGFFSLRTDFLASYLEYTGIIIYILVPLNELYAMTFFVS